MLFTMAKVMVKVIALILQGIEGLIFDFPARPAAAHQVKGIILGDCKIANPGEMLVFVSFDFPVFQKVDPHIWVRLVEGRIIEKAKAMREAIYALLQKDPIGFVDRMERMGMLAETARPEVERRVAAMFERIASDGGALALSGGQVLNIKDEAKKLLSETPGLQLPNDLLLYAKTLSYLFALCERLEPDVDVMKLSVPYLLKFLAGKG